MTPTTIIKNVVPSILSDDFSTGQWKNRRLVIMTSLLVCGFCLVGITLVVIGSIATAAWQGSSPSYDKNIVDLASSIVWGVITLATSIIGAYVFAANFDTKDYRKNVVEMQSRGVSTTVESKVTTTGATPATIQAAPLAPDRGDQPDETTTTDQATVISVDPGTTTTIQTDTSSTTNTRGPAG